MTQTLLETRLKSGFRWFPFRYCRAVGLVSINYCYKKTSRFFVGPGAASHLVRALFLFLVGPDMPAGSPALPCHSAPLQTCLESCCHADGAGHTPPGSPVQGEAPDPGWSNHNAPPLHHHDSFRDWHGTTSPPIRTVPWEFSNES